MRKIKRLFNILLAVIMTVCCLNLNNLTSCYAESVTETNEDFERTSTVNFRWPTDGGVKQNISSKYGYRWNNTDFHFGIDITGKTGQNIYSAESGKVTKTGYISDGYGNYVVVKHNNGYYTLYAHCNSIKVKKGASVSRGQVIATIGTTGYSTGPHVHFEVRKTDTLGYSSITVNGKKVGNKEFADKNLYNPMNFSYSKEDGLSIKNYALPTTIVRGSKFNCTGMITSGYTITVVTAKIMAADETTVLYSKSVWPKTKSYDLSGSEVSAALKFEELQPGTYYYKLWVTDTSLSDAKRLISQKFTVIAPASQLKISDYNLPTTITSGNGFNCKGNITSNYDITVVTAKIMAADETAVLYSKSVWPRTKVYNLEGSEVSAALKFEELQPGTYYYKLWVTDASLSDAKRLISQKFEVTGHVHNWVKYPEIAPTCTEEGWTAYEKCSICGGYKSSSMRVPIAPLGHNEVADALVRATLTTDGHRGGSHCSVCNSILSSPEIIYVPKTYKLSQTKYVYDGKAKRPVVTVIDRMGNKLVANRDYTTTYSNNVKAGKAKVQIKFIGNYSGIKTLTYTIKEQYDNTQAYVARIYTKALGRNPEPAGLKYWTNEIQTGKRTPVQVAEEFFFAPEFVNKKLNNTEYVKVLYRTFMGREYDKGGLNYWVGRLNKGESRKSVLEAFAGCPEFQKIVKSFGL